MYLNSFYFGMFATCEIGMGTLKAVNLDYKKSLLIQESAVLLGLCILESIRIHLGRKGSLSDHGEFRLRHTGRLINRITSTIRIAGWQVICSVVLTIPCAMGVVFLLFQQSWILKLEYILCALMLLLQITELVFAVLFVFSLCKQPTYD